MKFKNKYKLIVGIVICSIFFANILCLASIQKPYTSDILESYSEYLSNNSILRNDKYNLFKSTGNIDNNYRNQLYIQEFPFYEPVPSYPFFNAYSNSQNKYQYANMYHDTSNLNTFRTTDTLNNSAQKYVPLQNDDFNLIDGNYVSNGNLYNSDLDNKIFNSNDKIEFQTNINSNPSNSDYLRLSLNDTYENKQVFNYNSEILESMSNGFMDLTNTSLKGNYAQIKDIVWLIDSANDMAYPTYKNPYTNKYMYYDNSNYTSYYTFTETPIGSVPDDWTVSTSVGITASINQLQYGRGMVFLLQDNSVSQLGYIQQDFSNQVNGTIEFAINRQSITKESVIYFGVNSLRFYNDGYIWYYGGTTWYQLQTYNSNTWYYIVFDFECSNGGYRGLLADSVRIQINDNIYNYAMDGDATTVNLFRVSSSTTDTVYRTIIDTIEYSWLEGYERNRGRYLYFNLRPFATNIIPLCSWFNGTHWFIYDDITENIYIYTAWFNYIGLINLNSIENLIDIYQLNNEWYISNVIINISGTFSFIKKFDLNWNLINNILLTTEYYLTHFTYINSKWYFTDYYERIHVFDLSFNYLFKFQLDIGSEDIQGLIYYDNYVWLIQNNPSKVIQYILNYPNINLEIKVFNQKTNLYDIIYNATLLEYNKKQFNLSVNKYQKNGTLKLWFKITTIGYFIYEIDELNYILSTVNYSGSSLNILYFHSYYENGTKARDITCVYKIYRNYVEYYLNWNKTDGMTYWFTYTTSKNYLNLTNIQNVEIKLHAYHGISSIEPSNLTYSNIKFEIVIKNNSTSLNNTIIYDLSDIYSYGSLNFNFTKAIYYTTELESRMNYITYGIQAGYTKDLFTFGYNSLYGFRFLKGNNSVEYSRFFDIPNFFQEIFVPFPPTPNPLPPDLPEPEPPEPKYWSYTSYRLVGGIPYNTTIGNWTAEFTPIEVQEYKARYYYTEAILSDDDIGWLMSLIFNSFFLFIQWILFLCWYGISFVFTLVGCFILAILWNICLYWIYIGLIWIVWFLFLGILWCIEAILWLWSNVLYPFLEWCYINLLPAIVEACIIILAFCITCVAYILYLGNVDFWIIYDQVYLWMHLIVDFLIELAEVFFDNIIYIMIFVLWYLISAFLLYFRYLYCRMRGYQEKAERMYYTFQIYIFPIVLIYDLIKKIIDMIPGG